MRVIVLTDFGSPFPGSFLPMLHASIAVIRERGFSPLVVLPARARKRDWHEAFEAQYPSGIAHAPDLSGRQLARWLAELVDAGPGPTLIHTHFSRFDIAAASLARRRRDVRVIWHFHTVLSGSAKARVRNRVRFRVYGPHVSRMLCVAPHLVEEIRRRGARADRVEYFPNGLDVRLFPGAASLEERREARAKLGIASSPPLALHIGRDWELKGGDVFLDAFERLTPDTIGLMVRSGETARNEVIRRGLDSRVTIIEGTTQVRSLHAASDLLMATSRGEGMPFVVVEALASGLPVAATDIPGHVLPGGGPPGFEVAPLDPAAIAATAQRLLERPPEVRAAASAAAHAWVLDNFGLDVWSERLGAVYDAVAKESSGEPTPTSEGGDTTT